MILEVGFKIISIMEMKGRAIAVGGYFGYQAYTLHA
jgi:hypothetical protein